jgi:hypothetical protein
MGFKIVIVPNKLTVVVSENAVVVLGICGKGWQWIAILVVVDFNPAEIVRDCAVDKDGIRKRPKAIAM